MTTDQIWNSERIVPGQTPENILRMHLARYIFAKHFVKNALVLDVASGTGYGSGLLSVCAREVVGGDISIGSVRFGKNSWRRENLSYFGLDAHKLPFQDRMFDVVVSFETIEHLSASIDFVSECSRVLKKDGLFVCSTCNRDILTAHWKKPLNPFHVNEFTEVEFLRLCASKFDQVELYGQLFLSASKRFVYMLYYTLGFGLVRAKAFPFLQPLLGSISNGTTSQVLAVDLAPRKFSSQSKFAPGYMIAVCKGIK